MAKRKRATALIVALLLVLGTCAQGLAADVGDNAPYVLDNDGRPMTSETFLVRYGTELPDTQDGAHGVLLRDGVEVESTAYVATGQTLETRTGADALLGAREVAVLGDVTGTGQTGLGQLTRIAAALSGSQPLEGIWLTAGDLNGSGAIDLSDLVIAANQYTAWLAMEDVDLQSKTLPLYLASPEESIDVTVYYADGADDIPYLSEEDARALLGTLFEAREDPKATIDSSSDAGITTWTRDNGSTAELNFIDSTVMFSNYNDFLKLTYSMTGLDVATDPFESGDGSVRYIERLDTSFERSGSPIFVDLGAYGIELLHDGGTGYIPLQTFSDMFYATAGAPLVYNGQMLGLLAGGGVGALGDLYYDASPGPRSEKLCEFTYNELCVAMDMFYGLSQQHDISGFDGFFEQTGLKEQLLSTDPVVADRAIKDLAEGYLGDLHSRFQNPSFYAGKDADMSGCLLSPSMEDMTACREEYGAARAEAFPDGAPAYQEVGNTAYVTFDNFIMPDDEADYYDEAPAADAQDTLGIIMYAHSQIMREDSPIENVVLDLSNNTGGTADAAVYTIGWFLGGKAGICLNDTLTGEQACTRYAVDVNADGVCDANDSIADKNLYCLISPVSFSCGNLVPAALRASEKVTLIGRKSRGGACVVRPLTAADGTMFRISGSWRISTESNGSFYDVDRGVEPNYQVTRIDRFYNRETLTEFVNGLYR